MIFYVSYYFNFTTFTGGAQRFAADGKGKRKRRDQKVTPVKD